MSKISLIWNKEQLIVHGLFLIVFVIEYIVGFKMNMDVMILISAILYAIWLYHHNFEFIIKYFHLLASMVLHLGGTFICDMMIFPLREINRFSSHNNCFGLLVIVYVLMIMFMMPVNKFRFFREYNSKREDGISGAYYLIWVIICLQFIVILQLLQAGSNVSLGLDRKTYAETTMSELGRQIKNNQFIFIPVIFMTKGHFKKIQRYIFIIQAIFIYYWTGEKFGPYLLFFYLVMLPLLAQINTDKLKTFVKYCICGIVALFIVLYLQYTNLYKVGLGEFAEYLLERAAQQGQVWWAVYGDNLGKCHVGEALNEVGYFANAADNQMPYAGQWKMMFEASRGYSVIISRIFSKSPLTSTTNASLFYYFGTAGLIFSYPILGLLYSVIIDRFLIAYKNREMFLVIMYMKLVSYVNSLVWASDFRRIFSWKFMILVMGIVFYKYIIYHRKISFRFRCNLENLHGKVF